MPVKPSTKEEEFFAREEYERKRKLEEEKRVKLAADRNFLSSDSCR